MQLSKIGGGVAVNLPSFVVAVSRLKVLKVQQKGLCLFLS